MGEVRTEQGGERKVCGGVEDCGKRERIVEVCNDTVPCKKPSIASIKCSVFVDLFPMRKEKRIYVYFG